MLMAQQQLMAIRTAQARMALVQQEVKIFDYSNIIISKKTRFLNREIENDLNWSIISLQ